MDLVREQQRLLEQLGLDPSVATEEELLERFLASQRISMPPDAAQESSTQDTKDTMEPYIDRKCVLNLNDIAQDDKAFKESKESKGECSLCLEPIVNEDPYLPCDCPYFKIHLDCLNDPAYRCRRCGVTYGRYVLMKTMTQCVAMTAKGRRCTKSRQGTGQFCTCHNRVHMSGRCVQVYCSPRPIRGGTA